MSTGSKRKDAIEDFGSLKAVSKSGATVLNPVVSVGVKTAVAGSAGVGEGRPEGTAPNEAVIIGSVVVEAAAISGSGRRVGIGIANSATSTRSVSDLSAMSKAVVGRLVGTGNIAVTSVLWLPAAGATRGEAAGSFACETVLVDLEADAT